MIDLDLLQTFVSVVDSGGFTRAGDRVNRTQSTISQQIKKLEEQVGRALLVRQRACRSVQLTEDGERLLGYARRLVGLAREVGDMMSCADIRGVVSLGIPEDFPIDQLIRLITGFNQRFPDIRLDISNGLSSSLISQMERRELDMAVVKRNTGDGEAIATWPEHLSWVTGPDLPLDQDTVPLVVYAPGCLYRERAIRALELAGRRWRIAFASPSLTSIQAAISANLGLSLLPGNAIRPDHRIVSTELGLGVPPSTELALVAASRILTNAQKLVADFLIEHVE
nr:LysR substrate-binding domain-containing protein [Pseudomonas sp. Marseille-Q3773]